MNEKSLKRYTNLASLISVLHTKKLTLLDPTRWEDKNDSEYLRIYGGRLGFSSLYALCFTMIPETSHHWKVYAPGADGVCIYINAEDFFAHLNGIDEIRHGLVEYKPVNELESNPPNIRQLPFLKRFAFRGEEEYRVIYESKKPRSKKYYKLPFEISWIDKVVLSNSLPKELLSPVRETLYSIPGCQDLDIIRSSLNENNRWKKVGNLAIRDMVPTD